MHFMISETFVSIVSFLCLECTANIINCFVLPRQKLRHPFLSLRPESNAVLHISPHGAWRIWIRTTYILKEMASKLAERLTSIIVLNGFRLKMSTLVGCKMKMKVQVFNRVALEIESTCRNYWKFESKCEWFYSYFIWEFKNALFWSYIFRI